MTRYVLGLTGSIGMGKSTTAAMFAAKGISIWDADATVHRLYGPDGKLTAQIGAMFPEVIVNGSVSRAILRNKISADATVLDQIQELVHPLVAADRSQYLATHPVGLVVLDIPLLYETGSDQLCDGVAVVSTGADTQKSRVLGRGEMTEQEFELILARQMPDAEKRRRATWIIPTDSLPVAMRAVENIIAVITQRLDHA